MSEERAPRTVPCPTCRRAAPYAESNAWRPFCSERCRNADLGAWASERFRIAEAPAEDAAGDDTGHGSGSPPAASH